MVSTSVAAPPASSSLAPTGDRYAALSDLDSIFKVQAPTPSVGQQGSVFSNTSSTTNSLGISSMLNSSSGSSAMSSGPNPFASTALHTQSNPFQSSTGGMAQSNGFPAGNAGFGTAPQSSHMNVAGAGMAVMAANQFSKMGGNQPGMFGTQGGTGSMQTGGFNVGQGQVSAGVSEQLGGAQFGGPQLGTSSLGGSQFGASQFGGSQFKGSQFGASQFGGNQFAGGQGGSGQMGVGQFTGGQIGGAPAMQQPQQPPFGGGMGTNQFGQQQQQQMQQFGGGWQQKPQSNPFMVRVYYNIDYYRFQIYIMEYAIFGVLHMTYNISYMTKPVMWTVRIVSESADVHSHTIPQELTLHGATVIVRDILGNRSITVSQTAY